MATRLPATQLIDILNSTGGHWTLFSATGSDNYVVAGPFEDEFEMANKLGKDERSYMNMLVRSWRSKDD